MGSVCSESERESHSVTICNMLLKCADISNPAREWHLCERSAESRGMMGQGQNAHCQMGPSYRARVL